jgi:hypothetical protein
MTPFHFDPDDIKEDPISLKAALGFVSNDTKKDFFNEMALRMSGGTFNANASSITFDDFDSAKDENALSVSSALSSAASVSSFLFLVLPLFVVIFG